jgi:hypothetical protein
MQQKTHPPVEAPAPWTAASVVEGRSPTVLRQLSGISEQISGWGEVVVLNLAGS